MPEEQLQISQITDPDNVAELLCDGPMNVHHINDRVILTFTHPRPDPMPLFQGTLNLNFVVRARIVITKENLSAFRDLLARVIDTPEA